MSDIFSWNSAVTRYFGATDISDSRQFEVSGHFHTNTDMYCGEFNTGDELS